MIKFELYEVPITRNKFDKAYFMSQAKTNNYWINNIIFASYNQRPSEPYKKARVKFTFYFKTIRKRDKQNYLHKFLCDGLVRGKIIIDDNVDVIGLPEIEFEFDEKKPRTKFEIWEVG